MTRPTLIIGLGGTGQQILTFLKKELLEFGGGRLPDTVKLLAFDTASRVHPSGLTLDDEEVYRLGNVMLEEGREYVCIGGYLYQFVQKIKEYTKHVESGQKVYLNWFPAKEFLRNLPQAAFVTDHGVPSSRYLGRLSLFMSLNSILGHLAQALRDLRLEVNRIISDTEHGFTTYQPVEIIVVSSLVGGTGGGTFIDIAWLVRILADEILPKEYALRGFFLLSSTFATGEGSYAKHMQKRGFAAWRELDRAVLSSGSGNRIVYDPSDPKLQITCDKPAYDTTYLIDPLRDTLPIYPPPEEGIFPAVAHLISFVLDRDRFAQLLNLYIPPHKEILDPGVYHSAIGGYTLKVPVYYAQAQFSHKLAQQVLDVLLAPEVNEKGRVTHLSQLSNGEVGEGMAGLQAAVSFLTGDMQQSDGQTIPNTKLLQVIGQHRAQKAQEDDAQIRHAAQGGLTTSLLPYFNALNQITEYDTETGQIESNDFTGELQWKIWRECSPSKMTGDTPNSAWTRLTSDATGRSVPNVRKRRFGVETVVKSSGPQLRGELGTEMEVPRAAQLKRFKKLLQAQTLRDLNGANPDARIARGGKLGYVLAFYKELSKTMAYFRGFLDDVRKVRSEDIKLAQVTRDAADHALKRYNDEKKKRCWLTFWDGNVHPDAHRAQRNWLLAEQRDIDRRRGDILLEILDETASMMKDYTDKTLTDIDNWIAHLATGDPNFNIESLYSQVTESLEGVEVNHALDQRLGNPNFQTEKTLGKVSQIITEHTFQHDEQMLAEALESITWGATEGINGLKLNCGIEFPGETPEASPELRAFRRDGENPAGNNLGLLLRLTEQPYYGVQHDYPLAKEISDVYPDGKSLANALHGHAEPFYRRRLGTVPPAVRQAFLRVNDANNAAMQDYFGVQFRSEFLTANPQLGGKLDKVSSDDRYKLTLVRSDDLMPSESFEQWHIGFESYKDEFADINPSAGTTPWAIHVFTAEQNAFHYEQIMAKNQKYRILGPEVVALIEDRQRFEMFFYTYAHGLIIKMDGEQESVQPNVFIVIQNYLSGQDAWPGLDQAVANHAQELGYEKCIEIYKVQMRDHPDGLVEIILREGEAEVGLVAHQSFHKQSNSPFQKYVDLADIAQLIYIEAIERIQQSTFGI